MAEGRHHWRVYRGVCAVSVGNQAAPRLHETEGEELEGAGVVGLWIGLMMGHMTALGENRL